MDLDTILGLLFFVFFVVLPLFSRGAGRRRGQAGRGQAQGTGRGGAPGTGAPASGRASASSTQDTPQVTLAEIRRRVAEAQKREEERARMAGRASSAPPSATRPGTLVGSDPFEGALVSVPERRLADIGERRPAGLGPEGRPGQEGSPPVAGAAPTPSLGPAGSTTGGAGGPGGMAGPLAREGAPGRLGDRYVIGREGTARGAQLDSNTLIGREGLGGQEGIGSRPDRAGVPGREGAHRVVSPTVAPTTRSSRRTARAARAEIGSSEPRHDGRRLTVPGAAARLGGAAALQTDKAGILQGLVWHEILSPPLALRRRRER